MKVRFIDALGNEAELDIGEGQTLRDALVDAGVSPHNSSRFASCQGFGTCGTCAVAVEGQVEPAAAQGIEAWRLGFPPHQADSGLRLACQITACSDLVVRKRSGFWGQDEPE